MERFGLQAFRGVTQWEYVRTTGLVLKRGPRAGVTGSSFSLRAARTNPQGRRHHRQHPVAASNKSTSAWEIVADSEDLQLTASSSSDSSNTARPPPPKVHASKGRKLGPQSPEHRRKRLQSLRKTLMAQAPERRRKRCSVCGEIGHNKLSCPTITDAMPRKNTVTCSQCGQPGHNSRSCPVKPRSTTVTCSQCGRDGHNCRTCPMRAKNKKGAKAATNSVSSMSRVSKAVRQSHTYTGDPADAMMALEANGLFPTDLPDSARGSVGGSAGPSGVFPDPTMSMDGIQPSPVMSGGGVQPPKHFGAGLLMTPVDNDPLHLGPIKPEYIFPLPSSVEDAVQLASTASYRAWLDKERFQSVEWLLPTTNAADRTMPASTQQQFNSAVKLSESMLRSLKRNDGLQGPLKAQLFEGADPVGKWEGERIATLIFPTAEYVDMMRDLSNTGADTRLMLIVNPQWTLEGQVVSDFGIGAEGQRRSTFAESFQPVFFFKRLSVFGDRITMMRVYPGGWQVYWTPASERTQMIGVEYRKPSFQRLVDLLRPYQESRTSMSWLERMRDAVPQSQAMQSWAGMQYDYDAGLPGGIDMMMDGSNSRRAASGKPVASESTVFVNASGDLDVNMQRHWSNNQPAPGGSAGTPWGQAPAWQGANDNIGGSMGEPPYSKHQSESGPMREDLHQTTSEGHFAPSSSQHWRTTEKLEEALAELTGDSSASGAQAEDQGDAIGGMDWGGAFDGGVFGQREPPGAWNDFGKGADGEGAGVSGETDLQKVARLRTRLLKVNNQMQALESERTHVLNELTRLSGGTRSSQVLRDHESGDLMGGSGALPAAPSEGGAPAEVGGLENEPLWQGDGGDAAKDMKNNMLDIFKNIGSIIPGNK